MFSDKKKYYKFCCPTPLGWIEITGTPVFICSILFREDKTTSDKSIPENIIDCGRQLDEYFSGRRTGFDINFKVDGTPFQKEVWNNLLEIPFGKTTTYGAIARKMGSLKKVRAVGSANGKNRLSIVIPCHRVIGTGNRLTGYGGGLWRKEWLLNHEQRYSGKGNQMKRA